MTAGLRQSSRASCLHWLAHAVCRATPCLLRPQHCPWLVDLTGWTLDGNPELMYAFPRSLDQVDLREILAAVTELDLTVTVTAAGIGHLTLSFRGNDVE